MSKPDTWTDSEGTAHTERRNGGFNPSVLNTWLILGMTAISAVSLFGVYVNLPKEFESLKVEVAGVRNEVAGVKQTLNQTQNNLNLANKDIGNVEARSRTNEDVNNRQWESIREMQSEVGLSLTREQFLEWKAEFISKNAGSGVDAPKL